MAQQLVESQRAETPRPASCPQTGDVKQRCQQQQAQQPQPCHGLSQTGLEWLKMIMAATRQTWIAEEEAARQRAANLQVRPVCKSNQG